MNKLKSSWANNNLWRSFAFVFFALLLFCAIFYVGYAIDRLNGTAKVSGLSMAPTIQSDSCIYANPIPYLFSKPQRGDIIVFFSPDGYGDPLVKRVIGLSGDRITAFEGQIYINGIPVIEPYATEVDYAGHWVVKEGFYFVLGDNRNQSFDSHNNYQVADSNVIGKAQNSKCMNVLSQYNAAE